VPALRIWIQQTQTASIIMIFLFLAVVLLRPALSTAAFALVGYVTYTLFQNRYGNGLLQYPGPFFASLTNFWRVRDAYVNGGKRPSYVRLHNEYGDVVRLGPNALSFASPAAIDDIYNPKGNMAKVIFSDLRNIFPIGTEANLDQVKLVRCI
jgi:hypothetical protein